MPRTPELPDSVYIKIIERRYKETGRIPRVDEVRDEVGVGSRPRISRLIKQVFERVKNRDGANHGPQSDLEKAVYQMIYPTALQEARQEQRNAAARVIRALRRKLQERRRQLESEYSEPRAIKKALQAQIKDLESHIRDLKKKDRHRASINHRLRAKLETTQESHNRVVSNLSGQISELKEAVSRGSASIDRVSTNFERSIKGIEAQMSAGISAADNARFAAEQDVDRLTKQLEAERKEHESTREVLNTLSQQVVTLTEAVSKDGDATQAIGVAMDALRKHLERTASADQIETLKETLGAIEQRLDRKKV